MEKDEKTDEIVGTTNSAYVLLSRHGYAYKINKETGKRYPNNLKAYTDKKTLIWTDENGNEINRSAFKLMYKTFVNDKVDYIANIVPRNGDWDNWSVKNLMVSDKPHHNCKPIIVTYQDGVKMKFASLKNFYNKIGVSSIEKAY